MTVEAGRTCEQRRRETNSQTGKIMHGSTVNRPVSSTHRLKKGRLINGTRCRVAGSVVSVAGAANLHQATVA